MTTIRIIQYKLRVVFWVSLLLSVFYACVDDTGSGEESRADLRVFDEWIADNKANNLPFTTSGDAISTREALERMTADGEYLLTADIDLGDEDWTPLFSRSQPFTGTLHGNGHIIYNLNINAPEANYQGLFAALSGASIRNLGIGVRDLHANAVAGVLAGYARNGIADSDLQDVHLDLENIMVAGMIPDSQVTVNGTIVLHAVRASYAGAALGYLLSGDAHTLINEGIAVHATGNTSNHGMVGGLVGYSAGTISNGRSSGVVSTQSGGHAGGLVGINGGIVRGSASGDVSTVSGFYAGGLVGSTQTGTNAVYGSYGSASGNVSTVSGDFVGGLVGRNYGTVYGSASGNVTTQSGQYIGGLVGANFAGAVRGAMSGMISAGLGHSVGGLIGWTVVGAVQGYSTGWIMVADDNTHTTVGVVVGNNKNPNNKPNPTIPINGAYYHSAGGDHVGRTGTESRNTINLGDADDTGTRGNNTVGAGIVDIAQATAENMPNLTVGTAVGEWSFTAGEWPGINLPEGVADYMDYTTSPVQPENFVD